MSGTEHEPRPRRGISRGAVVALVGAVSGALLVAAVVAGVPLVPSEPDPAAGQPPASGRVELQAPDVQLPPTDPRDNDRRLVELQANALRTAAGATLDRRSAAVLAGDAAAVVETADVSAAESYAVQQAAADNLARLPFAEFGYTVESVLPDAARPGAYEVSATLTQRLVVEPEAHATGRRLTMAPAPNGWTVVADVATGAPLLWEVGELSVAQSEHALVVAVGDVEPERYVDHAEFAAVEVTRVWGTDWAQQVLVVVPSDSSTIERVLGYSEDSLGSIVALTTSEQATGPTGEVRRIFVNPGPFGELGSTGRRAILTHETVHVATGSPGSSAVPLWFEEGFADTVGFGAVDVSPGRGAVEALQSVEASGLPSALPTDADFAFTNAEVGATYGMAWIACRSLATRYGVPALISVYRDALAGTGSAEQNLTDALASELGLTLDEVITLWRSDLSELTGVT